MILLVVLLYILISVVLYKKSIKHEVQKRQYKNNLKMQMVKVHKQNQIKVIEHPPEIIKLNDFLIEFEETSSWDILIAVGDIYRKGSYPRFKADKHAALDCYKVAAMCPDGKIAGLAQIKYIETCEQDILSIDNTGDDLPTYYSDSICKLAKEIIMNTPYMIFNRPVTNNINTVDDIMPFINNTNTLAVFARPTVQNANNDVYKNDLQNVHDHSVSQITKKNLNYLKEEQSKTNNTEKNTKEAVIDQILQHPELSNTIKGNALLVLDNLNKKEKHSTFNVTEQEALDLVWNKIKETPEIENKNNLVEILARQLDTGIENGHIVCSSGKIARIIGSLDGVDENMTASKPMWVLKEEIATLAGKIMNSDHNNPKETFTQEVYKTYIEELKLEPTIINPIIDEYIEHL